MDKFKVGDRVRVYGGVELTSQPSQKYFLRGDAGTVESVFCSDSEINIQLDEDNTCHPTSGKCVTVHPKQCRKLVKRERRRAIYELSEDGAGYFRITVGRVESGETVEFIEVRKNPVRKREGKHERD